MKKVALILLALLLMAGCSPAEPGASSGAGAPAGDPVVLTEPASTAALPTDAAPSNAASETLTLEKKMNAMLPVLDSIVRTMGVEGEGRYAPEDPAFIWNVLYLAGENWGGLHPLVRQEGDTVIVPAEAMLEYASGAFAGLAALPEIPAALAQSVRYDAAMDAYLLAPSDAGAAETELAHYALEGDGSIFALVRLFVAEDTLGSLRFTLVPNAAAETRSAPVFLYSVKSAAHESGHSAFWQEYAPGETMEADLNGDGAAERITVAAADDDRARVTIEYGGQSYEDAFEYLYNISWHVGDALAADNARELYVCGDTGSDDYETYIYRLTEGGVQRDSLYGAVLYADGSGLLPLDTTLDVLGTYGGLCAYRADNGFTRASDYAVYQFDAWAYRALTLKKDGLTAISEADQTELSLPAGAKLVLLRTDRESYALCQLEDGRLVRLALTKNADDWEWRLSGAPESEWFTELLYAG